MRRTSVRESDLPFQFSGYVWKQDGPDMAEAILAMVQKSVVKAWSLNAVTNGSIWLPHWPTYL